jgi:hypothetical protein
MTARGKDEAWSRLTELLCKVMSDLQSKREELTQAGLAEFAGRASNLGFGVLSQVAAAQAGLFKYAVLPEWDEEAVATLHSSLGALLEKMRMGGPGPRLDSDLQKILASLEVFDDAVKELPSMASIPGMDLPQPELNVSVSPPVPEEAIPVAANTARPTLGDTEEELMTGGRDSWDYVMDRADWYRELLREDPSSVLFCELAQELCSMRLWREAVQVLRAGLHHHPRHMRGHALLGWALWEYGAAEEAERALKLVKREMEKIAVVYRVLGEISTHEGNIEEANRFETIHSLMVEATDAPEIQWVVPYRPSPGEDVTQRIIKKRAEDVSVSAAKPSEFLSFLNALMDGFQKTPVLRTGPLTVFSGQDRKALEQLFHAHAGTL